MVCLFVFFLQRIGWKRQEAVSALFRILFISGYGELFRQMLPEVNHHIQVVLDDLVAIIVLKSKVKLAICSWQYAKITSHLANSFRVVRVDTNDCIGASSGLHSSVVRRQRRVLDLFRVTRWIGKRASSWPFQSTR